MNDTMRLICGSTDTMHTAGRHHKRFVATVGLFLEMGCLLEITMPTVLHLVVPPNDAILH